MRHYDYRESRLSVGEDGVALFEHLRGDARNPLGMALRADYAQMLEQIAGDASTRSALASRRSPLMPDVPSVAELGFAGLDASPFINLQAPAATPAPIVEQLNLHARRALQSAAVRSKLEGLYFEVADGGDPALLGAWQRAEFDKWGAVIRSHGLKLD